MATDIIFLPVDVPNIDNLTSTSTTNALSANQGKEIKTLIDGKGNWSAYTPTSANITIGNGTLDASYTQIGKTIHFRIKFTLGNTSAIGTTPYFSLPATANAANINSTVILSDANVGLYNGTLEPTTGNAIPTAIGSTGTYTNFLGITATVPFTWTTTDYIKINGTYEAA